MLTLGREGTLCPRKRTTRSLSKLKVDPVFPVLARNSGPL